VKEKYIKKLDYLFIFRPMLFFPIWAMLTAGYGAGYFFNENMRWWSFELNWSNILMIVLMTVAAGAASMVSMLRQGEHNSRIDELLSKDNIPPKTAGLIAVISIGIALLLIGVVNLHLFLLASLFVFLNGFVMNYRPFLWRENIVLKIIAAVFSGLLLFVFGWILSGHVQLQVLYYAIPYLLGWTALYLLADLPENRIENGVYVKKGEQTDGRLARIRISFLLFVLAFAGGMISKDPVIAIAGLLSSVLFVIILFKPNEVWAVRTLRYPILFILLMLCVEFPLFFIVLLANYYFCKFYYQARFGLYYPTFHIEEEQ